MGQCLVFFCVTLLSQDDLPQCLPGRHRVPRLQQSRFWTVEPVAYRRQATARVDVRGAG